MSKQPSRRERTQKFGSDGLLSSGSPGSGSPLPSVPLPSLKPPLVLLLTEETAGQTVSLFLSSLIDVTARAECVR